MLTAHPPRTRRPRSRWGEIVAVIWLRRSKKVPARLEGGVVGCGEEADPPRELPLVCSSNLGSAVVYLPHVKLQVGLACGYPEVEPSKSTLPCSTRCCCNECAFQRNIYTRVHNLTPGWTARLDHLLHPPEQSQHTRSIALLT